MATVPTKAQERHLISQVEQLVRAQTNIFIRELLRELRYPPGSNKQEFTASLAEAIRAGDLTQEKLDTWLRSVEGWGNQHIYAFGVPSAVAADAAWRDESRVAAMVARNLARTWRAETSRSFPTQPKLTRTDYDPERGLFLAEWYEKTDVWARAQERDRKPVEIEGDTYWFQAYRYLPNRSVMRFVLWLRPPITQRPIAGLFLRYPIRNQEHCDSIELAWRDLAKMSLAAGTLADVRHDPWSISNVIKRLDQQVLHAREHRVQSKTTTFSEGLASVRFVAPPNFEWPDIIREVRLSLPEKAIENPDLIGTAAEFHVRRDPQRQVSREARVELFQEANRIRIWTELDEIDVWTILQTFDALR